MKRFAFVFIAFALAGAALAQQHYPNRPLRMVIPWPPGQATDLAGRIVAQKLSDLLNQQVVADNRPGAGGMIGTDVVAKAAPDGYTLLAASAGPITISPLLQKAPYDYERELAPVANVGLSPYILVTNPSFPAKSALEFVAAVKAAPGRYTFSSSGAGAAAHLVAEWFNNMNGLKATHVPFKGSAPALIEVASGQVTYSLETAAATLPHVRAGRLKAYGVSLARGTALAPDIPPLEKIANMPGFDVGAWIGVMVAAGTSPAIVSRLATAVDRAMKGADVRERIAAAGLEVDYRPTREFAPYLKEQKARFVDIIRVGNIKIE
ncbi:MAG TPA: tripartite tricarboxylate transporter substrate binding protein [Burkholderiales bacterium]|nr:tripartite tricarboxylate transporter substrate binding protein [Burkholderiales bacterium]